MAACRPGQAFCVETALDLWILENTSLARHTTHIDSGFMVFCILPCAVLTRFRHENIFDTHFDGRFALRIDLVSRDCPHQRTPQQEDRDFLENASVAAYCEWLELARCGEIWL